MSSVNQRILDGDQALTVEPFTELNSKLGAQWLASFFSEAVPAGTTVQVVIETGDDRVILKDAIIQFTSEKIKTRIYKSPSFSGGTLVDIYNYNDETELVSGVNLKTGATVTAVGTQISPEIASLGDVTIPQGAQVAQTNEFAGVERVLSANSSYLVEIENFGDSAGDISVLATWYEGPLSTDRKKKTNKGF